MTRAFVLIVIGLAMECVALVNPQFYARKGWFSGDKEVPRWLGRLLFGIIGALCIVVGCAQLVRGY